MIEKTKIALICFDNPFLKPSEGGKRSMMTRIRSLLLIPNCDIDVYLLCKPKEGIADQFWGLDKDINFYQYIMNPFSIKWIFSKYPICSNKRFISDCVEELRHHQYDIAIFEGEQVAKYRLLNVVRARKHILYFHDIESEYRKAIADTASGFVQKMANLQESRKFKTIEGLIPNYFDAFWFISKDEHKLMEARLKNKICFHLPAPAIEISEKAIQTENHNNILYVGDLTVAQNFLSIKWFIHKVFPLIKVSVKDVECIIIGRIMEEGKRELEVGSVKVMGYVDDLDGMYQNAACVIAPVLYGAGVKVKVIDALGKGQIVITTLKGIEGTELINEQHLFVANDPDEFAKYCIDVLSDREKYSKVAEKGLEYIKTYHTIEYQTALIEKTIKQLLGD